MKFSGLNNWGKRAGLVVIFLHLICFLFAQTTDSTKIISHFSGKIFATNNGISLVPSFSLDKPAILFNLSIGCKKLTFEPDVRFSLEDGKPWSLLYWFRYKAVQIEHFSLRTGAHLGLNYRTITALSNNVTKDVIETRRFWAGEIAPTYSFSDKVKVGAYYLYSLGLDDSQKHTHFLVLTSAFPNIMLTDKIKFGLFPVAYYLRLDDRDGFYVSSTFSLSKKDFPISLEAIINQKIRTDIQPERRFVWNISLVYSFNKEYVEWVPKI
ncbi:hypothetical protein CRP01_32500 [Flavilitoribacter nigricans DSM 23189 = NBRC 102662]|uniref:DUF2490 domain-containing protein n=2 Tax=Flavilitoribacter TaxID=2762562 RepID=A0A2D0N1M6_FLAN2|nr:hypothetical protein CRP01_32500 [Flavilitoribacter nigricans DSM 23189 = NBRC 102662]